MSPAPQLKSTQIVAGVAVVLALAGGAYAVGRSQSPEAVPEATPKTAAAQPKEEIREESRRPQRLAAAESPQARRSDDNGSASALCDGCGRVTDVHTEARRGQGSGVGAVGGAVVGGLLGNMIGGGTGKKLATVGGAVAGGYAGNEIEKNQKSYTVWVVKVEERDGRTRRFERSSDPGLRVGDEVRLSENGFTRT